MKKESRKSGILDILKKNQGEFISGEELSSMLGISRTAVWKHVKSLRADGYEIYASSNNGYRLFENKYIFNGPELSRELGTETIGRVVYYFSTIDSTNNHAKKLAAEGVPEGTAIFSSTQTGGRGRLGRSWYSPDELGIYMSVVLRPVIPPEDLQLITLAASVAVVEVLTGYPGLIASIKWPNDILVNGRKICGILAEMSSEPDIINYIILGLGINYGQKASDFPEEFSGRATSVLIELGEENNAEMPSRLYISREIMKSLDRWYSVLKSGGRKTVIDKWKKYTVMFGREVSVTTAYGEFKGFAENIDADGRLLVRLGDGSLKSFNSGEVSIGTVHKPEKMMEDNIW